MRENWKGWVRASAWGIFFFLGVSLAASFACTHRMIPPLNEPPFKEDWGVAQQVRLQTGDGLGLGAWYLPSAKDKPSIILLHGYWQRRTSVLPIIRMYAERGCAVLAVSARAHGDSNGFQNDIGYSARHDLAAAVAFLEENRKGQPIVAHGISMGAATAIYSAKEMGTRVSGYILEAPYLDAWTAIDHFTTIWIPQPFAWLSFQGFRIFGPWFLPEINKMSPLDHAVNIEIPVLFLAGEKDRRARPVEIAQLMERIKGPASMAVFKGAGHEQYLLRNREQYLGTVENFLAEMVRGKVSK